jgi:2-polyprenyl-3-methyl-5-hydroxy-6-metoxy-1,4-benzoquinol methylase
VNGDIAAGGKSDRVGTKADEKECWHRIGRSARASSVKTTSRLPFARRVSQYNAALSVAERPLSDLLTHLQRERDEADRALQEAVTAQPARLSRIRGLLRRLIGAAPDGVASRWLAIMQRQAATRDRLDAELIEELTLAQQRILALRREVERLSAAGGRGDSARPGPPGEPRSTAAALDDAEYLGFENRFRGSEALISRRQQDYLPLFASCTNVLDVGCGRGELLELFRTNGVTARGIDMNTAMVARCRERGLDVEQSDAIGYLERQPDGSIGGLTALQVVEHLQPAELLRFLRLAYDKLRPGAPIVLETINAACWAAFFDSYICDLTHARPLHPNTLEYYVRACGFSKVDVQFREPVDERDRLQHASSADPALAALVAAVNANADTLNARMFSHRDYAVIARR